MNKIVMYSNDKEIVFKDIQEKTFNSVFDHLTKYEEESTDVKDKEEE